MKSGTDYHKPGEVGPQFHEDCRECKAGLSQVLNATIGFYCPEHGVIEYDVSQAMRELEAALLAADNLIADLYVDRDCEVPDERWGAIFTENSRLGCSSEADTSAGTERVAR